MRLYRAIGPAEWADIQATGQLRPAPPSYQGKWFAETATDAFAWGGRLYQQAGMAGRVIEVEVDTAVADQWFRLPFLDRVGPARFADIPDLPSIRVLGEVPAGPSGNP